MEDCVQHRWFGINGQGPSVQSVQCSGCLRWTRLKGSKRLDVQKTTFEHLQNYKKRHPGTLSNLQFGPIWWPAHLLLGVYVMKMVGAYSLWLNNKTCSIPTMLISLYKACRIWPGHVAKSFTKIIAEYDFDLVCYLLKLNVQRLCLWHESQGSVFFFLCLDGIMSLVLLTNSLHRRVLTVENELNLHLNKAKYMLKIHFINTFGKTMHFFKKFCWIVFLAKKVKISFKMCINKPKEHKWLSDRFSSRIN